jgi:lipopolysaccharide export LptBFGC system permease protein LptF
MKTIKTMSMISFWFFLLSFIAVGISIIYGNQSGGSGSGLGLLALIYATGYSLFMWIKANKLLKAKPVGSSKTLTF